MTPIEAALRVLSEAGGETLHWTVIWDRALKAGYIDPLANRGARDELIRGLSQLARAAQIERVAPGTYRLPPERAIGP